MGVSDTSRNECGFRRPAELERTMYLPTNGMVKGKYSQRKHLRIRKKTKQVRGAIICLLFNGFAWSTENLYMERYRSTCDIFFGIEHRLRRYDMEDKFNKKAKQGWRFAADAPVHTNESASSVDCKHTSGGVSLAIDISFGSVVDKKKKERSRLFLGHEVRLAQAYVFVRRRLRLLRYTCGIQKVRHRGTKR